LRALVVLLGVMFFVRPFTYLVSSYQVALAIMVPSALIGAVGDGPLFAVIQTLVPERLRAMSIALIYLVANLVGAAPGPFAMGLLRGAFRPWAGESSRRNAMVAFCPVYLWAMWHLWGASEAVTGALQTARIDRAPAAASSPLTAATTAVQPTDLT